MKVRGLGIYLVLVLILVLNLFFVNAIQESYGNLTYTTVNGKQFIETGAKIGEWTHDIEAARALAKINNNYFLINFGKLFLK